MITKEKTLLSWGTQDNFNNIRWPSYV